MSPEPGTLASRIALAAHPCGAAEGEARLTDWLADLAATPGGNTLTELFADHPAVKALIAVFANCAPYLWTLAREDPARLAGLLQSAPDARFEDILAGAAREAAALRTDAELMTLLRRMKAEAALLIALADTGGAWPVTQVIAALTKLADAAVTIAVRHL